MRRHPESIRAVVLRGVAPPPYSIGEDFDHDSLRALNLVFDDCVADEKCVAAFPRLRAELDETLKRLESEPGTARVRDPFGEGTVSVPVTRELFAASVHYALYLKQTAARLPAMIHRAHAGDFDDLVGNVVTLSVALAPQMSTGAFLSVACAEDAPFVDADAVAREARNTLLQGMFSVNLARMCEHWDVPAVPAEFKQHVRSEAPVLLISGDADPVTPPRWAEEALRHLPNGKHVVLPETGHGDLAPGCVAGLVARLFETASTADLDVECASRVGRPGFE
jgi:pimeloyl-ACP methyl ester carboxylesterase